MLHLLFVVIAGNWMCSNGSGFQFIKLIWNILFLIFQFVNSQTIAFVWNFNFLQQPDSWDAPLWFKRVNTAIVTQWVGKETVHEG